MVFNFLSPSHTLAVSLLIQIERECPHFCTSVLISYLRLSLVKTNASEESVLNLIPPFLSNSPSVCLPAAGENLVTPDTEIATRT